MATKVISSYDKLEDELRRHLSSVDQSLQYISNSTQISKTHLANFKNGKRNLSFPNMNRLAEFLGIRYELKNF